MATWHHSQRVLFLYTLVTEEWRLPTTAHWERPCPKASRPNTLENPCFPMWTLMADLGHSSIDVAGMPPQLCHATCSVGSLPAWQPRNRQPALLDALRLHVSQLIQTKEKLWKHPLQPWQFPPSIPSAWLVQHSILSQGPILAMAAFCSSLFLWAPPPPQ